MYTQIYVHTHTWIYNVCVCVCADSISHPMYEQIEPIIFLLCYFINRQCPFSDP